MSKYVTPSVHTTQNLADQRHADWLTNQPTNQPTNQLINQPTNSMACSPSQDTSRSSASQQTSTFYATWGFTSLFTKANHLSMLSHPISLRFTLILSSHLTLGFPSYFLLSGFPTKILCRGFLFTHMCATGPSTLFLDFLTLPKTYYIMYSQHNHSEWHMGTACSKH